ncbi:hypothetical protein HQ325_08685 [Rhodococcus sp. BP-349]|uniref:hypothetical protein n=1 Tax=unclassified Rhodococcus (in: high G+C Gram-positive bacteria) TaxID=192944 RepID=UPI001C9B5321|nr:MULTISPECIES: hypothetical protein [unclassified Rhodococcus (in: high G+C Gram-positive bacteria)]MBY6538744.1 hypothetical protein [Rhodococcus sp. BP-363]MBY6543081.1 hypothetical protein [Rhodococcus sp. BP-369]MBY6562311.1 hypothetical protein [Rhodococcus sp. BP-370]MBY6576603.1 hypothetical protein [Rhodococcus sp. BP-364]MBY6585904.1 hypothetical protein [Rhodococcus sp. BP-358]
MQSPRRPVPGPDSMTRWSEAVEAGARGWYAASLTGARSLRRDADPAVRSLSASLEGSLLRQLGRHTDAAVRDGAALADSGYSRAADPRRAIDVDAAVDALVGLAADSLGPRRLARADDLLIRAEGVLATRPGRDRVSLRVLWVRAEVAMASGDARRALDAAEASVRAAQEFGSPRHLVKSRVVHAAARLVAGHRADAATAARSVRADAADAGLLPLAWAAACLSEACGDRDAGDVRRGFEVAIRSRGGQFS